MRKEITELVSAQDATFLQVITTREEARANEPFFYQLRNLYTQLTDRTVGNNLAQLVNNNLYFIFITQGTNLIASATIVFVETAIVRKGLVEDVVVSEFHRKLHLGKVLVDEAIRLGRERRARYLQLTSKPERSGTSCFYAKAGFEPVAFARERHEEGTNLYRYCYNKNR